ncbi:hypothetical protein K9N68_14000 [Kovacikia minuta CCNUW1]|uniref:hypothetical protein n=1 Tax=Kovacikia minuta TaxID=2931930 RepID=UPI001CCDE614|nr:hypothetical protein [Kovacikia minuta]UBF28853.1 hypothetical protein K9N68_14000 [Kovacikia minuta CCNUW1]
MRSSSLSVTTIRPSSPQTSSQAAVLSPLDWELSRPPVFSAQASQVSFTSGINIVAQPGSVTFSESITNKPLEEVAISHIASKYAAALPNLDYRAIGISPKRFITFEHQPNAARTFITKTLLSHGSWQNAGTAPLQASITLAYTFDQSQLRLNIAEARLQSADKEPIPTILFAGSFHYDLDGELGEARLKNLHQVIEHWRTDLEAFQNLIDTQFLPLMETSQAGTLKAVG